MKKLFLILETSICILNFPLLAQTHKLYDTSYSENVHTIMLSSSSWARYDSFPVTTTGKYYYDENDNRVLEGPVVRTGEIKDNGSIWAKYDIRFCFKDGKVSGKYSYAQSEGRIHQKEVGAEVSFNTTFQNGHITDYFDYYSKYTTAQGYTGTESISATLASDGSIKTLKMDDGANKIDITFDDKGRASGSLEAKGTKLTIINNIVLEYYQRQNKDQQEIDDDAIREIVLKYANDQITLDELMECGFYTFPLMKTPFTMDKRLTGGLVKEDFGKAYSVDINLNIIGKIKLTSLEELKGFCHRSPYNVNLGNFYLTSSTTAEYKKYVVENGAEKVRYMVNELLTKKTDIMDTFAPDQYITTINLPSEVKEINLDEGFTITDITYEDNNEFYITYNIYINIPNFDNSDGLHIKKYAFNALYDKEVRNSISLSLADGTPIELPSEWDKYRTMQQDAEKLNKKVITALSPEPQALMSYTSKYDSFDSAPVPDFEQSVAKLQETINFSNMVQEQYENLLQIRDNNNNLMSSLSEYKNVLKAYSTYYSSLDLVPDFNESKEDYYKDIINKQEILLDAAKNGKLTFDKDKSIKKLKDKSFSAIIEAIKSW